AFWRRRVAARARTPTQAAGTQSGPRKSSARRQNPKKCAAYAKLFSNRCDASWADRILALAITNHRTKIRSSPRGAPPNHWVAGTCCEDPAWIPAYAGMSGGFRRARSTPARAPHAGAAPVGALAAPAPAAGAARKPARADGVLRAAGNPHGDIAGRGYASRKADRAAARGINHSSD